MQAILVFGTKSVLDEGKWLQQHISIDPSRSSKRRDLGCLKKAHDEHCLPQAARQYDQSKPPRRSVVSISALMSGGRSIGTISLLSKPW